MSFRIAFDLPEEKSLHNHFETTSSNERITNALQEAFNEHKKRMGKRIYDVTKWVITVEKK